MPPKDEVCCLSMQVNGSPRGSGFQCWVPLDWVKFQHFGDDQAGCLQRVSVYESVCSNPIPLNTARQHGSRPS